jgi:hypothetical protein
MWFWPQQIPAMLKLVILITTTSSHSATGNFDVTHSRHAKTDALILTTTHFSHDETDHFDNNTFQQWWNWHSQIASFSMAEWVVIKITSFSMPGMFCGWQHQFPNCWQVNWSEMLVSVKLTLSTTKHFIHAKTDFFNQNTFQPC